MLSEGKQQKNATIGIITISDTRTYETDQSGFLIEQLLNNQHHSVIKRTIVKDEPTAIKAALSSLGNLHVDFIITNGGTGISRRDITYETITALFDKEIIGFGELFRFLSYRQVGTRSILSRATAGMIGNVVVFVLPGSIKAVELAVKEIILHEIPHLLHERVKHHE